MKFLVFEKATGEIWMIKHNVSTVDQHIDGRFVLWFPDEKKMFAKYEIITINPETQWVSIMPEVS